MELWFLLTSPVFWLDKDASLSWIQKYTHGLCVQSGHRVSLVFPFLSSLIEYEQGKSGKMSVYLILRIQSDHAATCVQNVNFSAWHMFVSDDPNPKRGMCLLKWLTRCMMHSWCILSQWGLQLFSSSVDYFLAKLINHLVKGDVFELLVLPNKPENQRYSVPPSYERKTVKWLSKSGWSVSCQLTNCYSCNQNVTNLISL